MSVENLVTLKPDRKHIHKYVFDCACVSVNQGEPCFEISIPDNFMLFSKDEQNTLFALLISQFESTPVFVKSKRSISSVSFVNEDIIEHKIQLILKYDEAQGFYLTVEGDSYILNGTSASICAAAIHRELISLEKILAEEQGSSLASN